LQPPNFEYGNFGKEFTQFNEKEKAAGKQKICLLLFAHLLTELPSTPSDN
jgi:hypothetical protein